jgi:hypothetical protein
MLTLWCLERLQVGEVTAIQTLLRQLPTPLAREPVLQALAYLLQNTAIPPADSEAQSKLTAQFASQFGGFPNFPPLLLRVSPYLKAQGWNLTAETLLWLLADDAQSNEDARHLLHEIYSAQRNSRGLWRLVKNQATHHPNNPDFARRQLLLSCLLGLDLQRIPSLMDSLRVAGSPENQLALAYAEYSRGRLKEALALLDSLPPENWSNRELAPYTAAVLKAGGRFSEARHIASLADSRTLLVEEEALLRQATTGSGS